MFLPCILQIMKITLIYFHRNRVKGYLGSQLSFVPHHFILFMSHWMTRQMGCSFSSINLVIYGEAFFFLFLFLFQ